MENKRLIILFPRSEEGDRLKKALGGLPHIEFLEYSYPRFFLDAERLQRVPMKEISPAAVWTDPDGLERTIPSREIVSTYREWKRFSAKLRVLLSLGRAFVVDLRFLPEGRTVTGPLPDIGIGYVGATMEIDPGSLTPAALDEIAAFVNSFVGPLITEKQP